MAGLLGAIVVGVGESLLHFAPVAAYTSAEPYAFMNHATEGQRSLGHFLAVGGLPLYFVGSWHIREMMRSGSERLANLTFGVAIVGFFLGGVWLSSRAFLGSLVGTAAFDEHAIHLYELRYETLLWGIRACTVVVSALIVASALRPHGYPRWVAPFAPAFGIALAFVLFVISPEVGRFVTPAALNVAYALFFFVSLAAIRQT